MTTRPVPKRGEVWTVNFDPTVGTEIRKTRPAVIISSDAVGKLPIKLIAPSQTGRSTSIKIFGILRLEPNVENGLSKLSAVDALQL